MPSGEDSCPSCEATHTGQAPGANGELLDGKWRLEQRLGAGGMGTVHLATDLELDRKVAIKRLSAALAHHPEVVARFEREARVLAQLEHPHLVPIYAVGRVDGQPFIVMKYLEGVTLTEHLRERMRLPLSEAVELMRQLCAGLALIHSRGFIHRDLKPGNIMIAPDGHATILDLGVAHTPGSHLTRSGIMLGTPRYMSPEQVLGTTQVDHRADLYSLGTVLYELVTGAPVFDSDSDYALMRMHVDAPVPDASQLSADLPRAVGEVLSKCLAKQPADRYQSATELFAAFDAAARAASSQPRPAPAPQPPRRRTPVDAPEPGPAPAGGPSARGATSDGAERGPGPTLLERRAADALYASLRRAARVRLFLAAGVVAAGAAGIVLLIRPQSPEPVPLAPLPPESAAKLLEAVRAAAPMAPFSAQPEPAPAPAPPLPSEPAPADEAPAPAAVAALPAPSGASRPQRRPARESARTTPLREKAALGELRITSTLKGELSWAWLDVDGVRRGVTPTTLKLAPGRHDLRLTRPGFRTVTRQVEVVPAAAVRIAVELTP